MVDQLAQDIEATEDKHKVQTAFRMDAKKHITYDRSEGNLIGLFEHTKVCRAAAKMYMKLGVPVDEEVERRVKKHGKSYTKQKFTIPDISDAARAVCHEYADTLQEDTMVAFRQDAFDVVTVAQTVCVEQHKLCKSLGERWEYFPDVVKPVDEAEAAAAAAAAEEGEKKEL
jgi:hypothetical protein